MAVAACRRTTRGADARTEFESPPVLAKWGEAGRAHHGTGRSRSHTLHVNSDISLNFLTYISIIFAKICIIIKPYII
jgi:hypothetical protein